jgi:hypothetical protein
VRMNRAPLFCPRLSQCRFAAMARGVLRIAQNSILKPHSGLSPPPFPCMPPPHGHLRWPRLHGRWSQALRA